MLSIYYLEIDSKWTTAPSSLTKKATAFRVKCSATRKYQSASLENQQEEIKLKSCC